MSNHIVAQYPEKAIKKMIAVIGTSHPLELETILIRQEPT